LLSFSNTAWIQGYVLTDDEKRMFTNVNTLETLERGIQNGNSEG
jgi:molybdenum cofactor guanylyltransferase